MIFKIKRRRVFNVLLSKATKWNSDKFYFKKPNSFNLKNEINN